MLGKNICLVGPTAVGKSSVGILLAKKLSGVIVGLDSRQIYKGMEIGTGQPTEEEKQIIHHQLIGVRSPTELISAGEYASLATNAILVIRQSGNLPIIVGGSGLYFRALVSGIFQGSKSDQSIRKKLKEELELHGSSELLETLKKIDPEYAEIVHINNKKRLLRALEIYEITGLPPSVHYKMQQPETMSESFFVVYIHAPIKWLEEKIHIRVNKMLDDGWVREVKQLLAEGVTKNTHSVDSLGYREIIDHLEGKVSAGNLSSLIGLHTKQFARKQMKWFDKERTDLKIDMSIQSSTESVVDYIIQTYKN